MSDEPDLYHDVTEPLLGDGAERSTMMGFPCVRIDGGFFASRDRSSGDLVVKLPADRVDELMASGRALGFAPNGRRFKEWAQITSRDEAEWSALVAEALAFVGRQA